VLDFLARRVPGIRRLPGIAERATIGSAGSEAAS
jgi:hypothetical protein